MTKFATCSVHTAQSFKSISSDHLMIHDKRWSVGRKRAVVLRLLRGESVDAVSREVGVTIAQLEQWRELALAGIEASLKSRQTDPLELKLKEAVHRVGELTMEIEILRMERERQERRPLIARRSST